MSPLIYEQAGGDMNLKFRVEEKREFYYLGVQVEVEFARVVEKWVPEWEEDGEKFEGFTSYEASKKEGSMTLRMSKEDADKLEIWGIYSFDGQRIEVPDVSTAL